MKTPLGESLFYYGNVSLEDYTVHTSRNLLYKLYSLFKIQHWNKTTGDTKNENVLLIAKNMTKIHFSKCKDAKQKKMKTYLRRVATCSGFILKAWLELNLLTNIKTTHQMDCHCKPIQLAFAF